MSIDIKKIQDIKKVDKPWGYEKWIADGSPNFKYALKEILLNLNLNRAFSFMSLKKKQTTFRKEKAFSIIIQIQSILKNIKIMNILTMNLMTF